MKFIHNEPALLIGKTMVIADLHLGVEHDYRVAGFKMPSQTKNTAQRILTMAKKAKANSIFLMGDIKHKVPGTSFQEEREVPDFFETISKDIHVEVVPGNHDGGLQDMIPKIKVHPASGLLQKNTFFCHGHSWPSPDFLNANFIIISHNHPLIELKDALGYRWRERAWIRSELSSEALESQYKKIPRKIPELVIMPAFSQLVGGYAMNQTEKKPLGPMARCAEMDRAKAFLLDGTFLGELQELRI